MHTSDVIKHTAAIIIMIILFAAFPLGVPASAAESVLFDTDNVLSVKEYEEIYNYAHDISDATEWNIAVEFDPDGDFTSESKAYSHCIKTFENCFGIDADGVFYYCSDHYTYLVASGKADNFISYSEAENVARRGDDIYSYDRIGSIKLVLDGIYNEFERGEKFSSQPKKGSITEYFPVIFNIGIIAVIGVLVFIIIVVKCYKFHAKPTVLNYIDSRAVHFPVRQDIFVRAYDVRHTNNSSHHSSGGHHSHGGGHRSGGHHSGGGRR